MEIDKTKNRRSFSSTLLIVATGWVVAFIGCIALQSVADINYFVTEITYLSAPEFNFIGFVKSGIYCLAYLVSCFFFVLIALQRSRGLALIFLVYVGFAYFVDLVPQLLGSRSGFTHFQYALIMNEAGNVRNLVAYLPEIVKAILIVCFAAMGTFVVRKIFPLRLSAWLLVGLGVCFGSAVASKKLVYYVTYASFPAAIKVPIIAVDFHYNSIDQPNRVLHDDVKPTQNGIANIFLIVDESISGTHLSINGYAKDTTPDLTNYVDSGIVSNFGVVSSNANCSALSQLMLRTGLSYASKGAADFIVTRQSLPTIYQYAKRAGYKTWLIDTQVKQGALTNHLTYDDLRSVDEYFTNDSTIEDYLRDERGLAHLEKVLKQDTAEKKFFVIVKDGAHWPYLWRFPRHKEVFSPVQRSEYEIRNGPVRRTDNEIRDIESRQRFINTYDNVIRFAVNDYLKKYIAIAPKSDAITFYTSDHGQSFFESEAKDALTHCSTYRHPPSSQVSVPLIVIDKKAEARYTPVNSMVYAQHQLFPTILTEMGYSGAITSRYGNTLSQGYPSGHQPWFYWSMEGDRSAYLPIVIRK
jgi:glucan phosphoethanolaminetransferase (alkaline phosphatase superfamily)